MKRTEEAIEVLISHGYEEEADILRKISKSMQDVEPVGFISDYGLRLIKEREGIGTTVSMLHKKHGAHRISLYTAPQDDKIRKAAEKVIKYWSEWTWWKECSGELLRDLKNALEGK